MQESAMRKLLVTAFVSLDGVMQAPGGPEEDPTGGFRYGGWTFNYFDDAVGNVMGGIFSEPYELLLGRKTYEIFAAHWPYQKDDPFAEALTNVRKYVVTSSRAPLAWKNSVAIHDVVNDVVRLKREVGPTLMTQGSSELIQALLKHDLVDRFTLLVFPLVLGQGKRLFGEGTMPGGLKLLDAKTSASGVTISTYERAGEIKPGSFAANEPSAEELARRERMKRQG
jgi:dihydrofolate reductase